jgi:hypothetical protein
LCDEAWSSAKRSVRPSPQRYSIATLRPSVQPSSRNRWTKAAVHWLCAAAVPEPATRWSPLSTLLCARRERPRGCRATDERDELTPLHAEHQARPSRARCVEGRIPRDKRAVLTARHLARARRAPSRTVNAGCGLCGTGCCCGRQSVRRRDDRRHDSKRCSRHVRICRKGREGLPKCRPLVGSSEPFSLNGNFQSERK